MMENRYTLKALNNHRGIILERDFCSKHRLNDYLYLLKNTSEWSKIASWNVTDNGINQTIIERENNDG